MTGKHIHVKKIDIAVQGAKDEGGVVKKEALNV